MQLPATHMLAHSLSRLVADRRSKTDKQPARAVHRLPRPKGIAVEIEALLRVAIGLNKQSESVLQYHFSPAFRSAVMSRSRSTWFLRGYLDRNRSRLKAGLIRKTSAASACASFCRPISAYAAVIIRWGDR